MTSLGIVVTDIGDVDARAARTRAHRKVFPILDRRARNANPAFDGTGRVEFSSCPYLAPCAYGWVPDYVTVQFVNIAV